MERMTVSLVPAVDEGEKAVSEIFFGGEVAMAKAAAADDREEDLNLVHPRCVQRCVEELELAAVPFVERGPTALGPVVVDVQIVPDHDDPLGITVMLRDPFHEGHEVVCATGLATVGEDLSVPDVEGGEQRLRAMADVFELEPSRPAGNRPLQRRLALGGRIPVFSSTHRTTVSAGGFS